MLKRLILLIAFMTVSSVALAQATLDVEVDKGRMLKLNSPAKSVFLANPAVADVQVLASDTIMIFGKTAGETTLVVVDDNNRTIVNQRIAVSYNLTSLREALRATVSDGFIEATSVPNGIVLSGSVKTPAQAEDARRMAARFVPQGGEVINRLAVSGPSQVMLRVQIAEMQRTVNKQFGLNWEALNTGNDGFQFGRGGPIFSPDNRYALIDPFHYLPLGDLVKPGGRDTLFGRLTTGQFEINVLMDALENEGLATILAEPSLTATTGETASFLAGGEYPIPIPSEDGIGIEYKPFGVSLSFTPTMIDGDNINIKVKPEVSQISAANTVTIQGNDIPTLVIRRAETTVELASGQSFAIAGLLQNNTNQTTNKFPFLGDLPILGSLFKSESFTRGESELVIIVTPYIVRPSDEKLATPIDNYDVPGDGSRLLLNSRVNEIPAAPFARLVDQPISFVVE